MLLKIMASALAISSSTWSNVNALSLRWNGADLLTIVALNVADGVTSTSQIDYGEFATMMRMGNGGIRRRTMRGNLNLGEALGVVQPEETV
ncbi:hypothetical protein Tco_0341507 [Tanacetum coccineum]